MIMQITAYIDNTNLNFMIIFYFFKKINKLNMNYIEKFKYMFFNDFKNLNNYMFCEGFFFDFLQKKIMKYFMMMFIMKSFNLFNEKLMFNNIMKYYYNFIMNMVNKFFIFELKNMSNLFFTIMFMFLLLFIFLIFNLMLLILY